MSASTPTSATTEEGKCLVIPTAAGHPKGAPWTFADAATYLGMSEKRLRFLCQLGKVKSIKLGLRKVAIADAEVRRLATEGV